MSVFSNNFKIQLPNGSATSSRALNLRAEIIASSDSYYLKGQNLRQRGEGSGYFSYRAFQLLPVDSLIGTPEIPKTLMATGMRKLSAGLYTNLSDSIMNLFGTPVRLDSILPQNCTAEHQRAVNRFWGAHKKSHLYIDHLSHFSFFDEEDTRAISERLSSHGSMNVLRLRQLFRGSGDQQLSLERQTYRQVLRGSRVFLHQRTINITQENGLPTTIQYIGLGICNPLAKVLKYNKSRDFFGNFLFDALENNKEEVFRGSAPESLDPDSIKKLAELGKWSPTLAKVFSNSPDLNNSARYNWSDTHLVLERKEYVSNASFNTLSKISMLAYSEEQKTLNKLNLIKERYIKIKVKASDKVINCERSLRIRSTNVRDNAAEIERLQAIISAEKVRISAEQESLVRYRTSLADSKQSVESAKAKCEEANQNLVQKLNTLTTESSVDWIANFKKAGLLIEDIIYNLNGENYSINSNPAIALNPASKLIEVKWRTLAPIEIKVDPKAGGLYKRIIYGGPYCFKSSRSTNPRSQEIVTKIKLAGLDSVFGCKPNGRYLQMRVHPHVTDLSSTVSFRDASIVLNSWYNICQGEVARPVWAAFESNNPKYVVNAIMAWARTCNSSDTWGRSEKIFDSKEVVDNYIVEREKILNPELKESTNSSYRLRLELKEAQVHKFWEVLVSGSEVTILTGSSTKQLKKKTTSFDSHSEAMKFVNSKIKRKINGGYTEVPMNCEGSIVETSQQPQIQLPTS